MSLNVVGDNHDDHDDGDDTCRVQKANRVASATRKVHTNWTVSASTKYGVKFFPTTTERALPPAPHDEKHHDGCK